MKLARLFLIALLTFSLPSLGLADVVVETPACPMHSGQSPMDADAAGEQGDHCAGMHGNAHATGGDTQSEHSCKADGKCGACNHATSALPQSAFSSPPEAKVAAVAFPNTAPPSRSPEGLWHPPRKD